MSIFGVLNTDGEVQTKICSSITLQGLEEQTRLSAHRSTSKGRSLKTALIKLQMYWADSVAIIHWLKHPHWNHFSTWKFTLHYYCKAQRQHL